MSWTVTSCQKMDFFFMWHVFSHALMNFSELNFQQAARRRRIHAPCEGLGRSAGAPLILAASRIICRVCVGCACTAGLQTPLRIVSNIVFGKQSTWRACMHCDGCGRIARAPRILVAFRIICRKVLRSCTPHAAAFTR